MHTFRTNTYKLHFFESASRLRFVLLTEPNAPDLRGVLGALYADDFVPHVAMNPRYSNNGSEPITEANCDLFLAALRARIAALTPPPPSARGK